MKKLQHFKSLLAIGMLMSCIAGCEQSNVSSNTNKNNESVGQTTLLKTLNESGQININDNWQYLQSNVSHVSEALEQTSWQAIDLPHTWNSTDTVDSAPGYRRDASWYKKSLALTPAENQRYVLYFEGANMETEVFVNGKKAGEHIGGYLGFSIEVTDLLLNEADNEIMVRVTNEYNPNLIPSQKADFFIHGGITRDVWLRAYPKNYIETIQVDMPKVSQESADVVVSLTLNNQQANEQQIQLSLKDPQGNVVKNAQQTILSVVGVNQLELDFGNIEKPLLWSPDSPYLYTLTVELLSQAGDVIQTANETIGFRWFEMRANEGFFVNGERMLIRGTHRHEEHAGIGAAMSNAMHYKDMQQIKDMGANFVRLGHYPQDPEVYKAANELGLVLWDELPWCRGGKGGAEWEANTEALWKKQIKQNRNHPSIAFWSLGNEMYWEEDFVGGGSEAEITPYLAKLNDLTKTLDPSRITTIRKYYPGAKIVDAFSPSIWAGWYGGSYGQYAEAITSSMAKYPTFLHMEYGASSHVGRHEENPISKDGMSGAQVSVDEAMNQAVVVSVAKDSDWNENYAVDLFDWHTHVAENTPHFAGNAQWAFKDFGTPLRPENPIPYMNQKGLVDRNGNPKDAYYVFASYWSKKPFCAIESKTWTHRNGPKEGRDVTVYCNTQSAELSLNGQSLGEKQRDPNVVPAGGLVWKVPFVNGKNQLRVVGKHANGTIVNDEMTVNYLIGEHGKIDRIHLSVKPLENGHLLIMAEAQDEKGNRVLDYNQRSYFFNMTSHGQLIENQGTPTGSSIIEMASGYAAIEFIPGDKPTTIEYRNQNIKGVYLLIE